MEIELGYDPFIDDCAPAACTAEIVKVDPLAVKDENVLIILDASGSMAETMGGQTRMQAAREVLTNYVNALPPTAKLGFMVYGHKGNNTEAGRSESCAGVELLAPVGGVSAENFPALLDTFSPNGWTPIAGALSMAEQAFGEGGGRAAKVVIVTDGLETCGGDPVATAARLHTNPQIQLIIDVVGFSILNEGDRAALERIAEAGGGIYHDVRSVSDFSYYVQGLVDRARALSYYAICIGQVALETNACRSVLISAANVRISQMIVELTLSPGSDHDAKIAALEQIQERINLVEEFRFEQYMEWESAHIQLLDEMEALDRVYEDLFPIP